MVQAVESGQMLKIVYDLVLVWSMLHSISAQYMLFALHGV